MVAKPLCPLYKNIIKPLDRARYPELRYYIGYHYYFTSNDKIGDYAFYGCSGLTSLTLPSGVTSIGNHAFYACSGLTSITLPSGVTSIGNHAFDGCTGLTSLTLPSGVAEIKSGRL